MHYGRDSEDTRLSPVYLRQPGLDRGYEITLLEASECIATSTSTCLAFDPLAGSRLALVNAELRFSLMGLFNRRDVWRRAGGNRLVLRYRCSLDAKPHTSLPWRLPVPGSQRRCSHSLQCVRLRHWRNGLRQAP